MGLYRVRSPTCHGISLSALQMRAILLRGVSVAGYNYVAEQRGLTIGLYNDARRLQGRAARVDQPGAKQLRRAARWLPLVNAHF